jgi:large subunit ribosomal protein L10
MTSHGRVWKETKKAEIIALAKEYPFIAVVTLEQLPANIVSVLRKKLNGEAKIVVAKTRVIQKAFAESDLDTTKFDSSIKESVAIIFSKKNPFELFSFVKKNKGDAVAKIGDIAEQDIIIQAGDTGLPPGPALSTLKAVGLKVQVAGPTIAITADKVVTKKGEEVTKEVVDVLGKLNMKPMKVGMSITGVFDKADNTYYLADVLNIDEEELFNKFVIAYQNALNLSVNAEYYNDVSTEIILIKAQREANALQDEVGVENAEENSTKPTVEEKIDGETVQKVEEVASQEKEEVASQEKEEVASQAVNDISEDKTEEKKENN